MPAYQATIVVGSDGWVPVSSGAVARVRVQNIGGGAVRLQATSSAAPPGTADGALVVAGPYFGEVVDMSTHYPAVGTPAYLWARAVDAFTEVSVSHA